MRKVILATIGTMGDLHPFIAIARALQERGFSPVLAVPDDHLATAAAAGIAAVAVLPGLATLGERIGLEPAVAAERIIGNQRVLFEQAILPDLAGATERLDALAADAEAIVASTFFLAAPIVAEKRDLAIVTVVLQPMALLSPADPPSTPEFRVLRRVPVGAIGRRWNAALIGLLRLFVDLLYGRRIDAVRREHGLAPAGATRMFEANGQAIRVLGCYSPHFAPLPPDAAGITRLVGFPLFDDAAGDGALEPDLAAWLAAGPAPLVFTLGTFAVHAAGDFYARAAQVAERLGVRAVLLTGREGASASETLFTRRYVPHSLLFRHAALIVHHGGIGTTGQALRSGRPQLVVPHMGDQHDHAWRIERLGVGRRIRPGRFDAARVTPILAAMLADRGMAAAAARIGERIAAEDGAGAAADAIAAALADR